MPIITKGKEATTILSALFADARRGVVFTGAGISTESGIPDFRSPGGTWERFEPVYFDQFVASEEARQLDWKRRFIMLDQFGQAEPNAGHRAIAALVAAGKVDTVVTQNIDGLHQRAGVPAERVIEIHGNGTFATCLDCGRRHELSDIRPAFEADGTTPRCVSCGGLVKVAVISFGQAMPVTEMLRAEDAANRADLFVAIGSSLVVYPAAGLPVVAKREGAKLVIINREPTELDALADVVIHDEIGSVMAPFAANTIV
ncbi:MAG: NAD-dependent deacetylase [Hyphomicrobiales bacterium]|nr:MAG: NAD-dependent deacetylase [Hyphomicrobiales bacterium]